LVTRAASGFLVAGAFVDRAVDVGVGGNSDGWVAGAGGITSCSRARVRPT